ncbi:MAG: diacylglycerol kinase family protein [Kofleriaceae bacterium]|nr:diacylglycerol kinase family protein [Kofleriaceae bacterium]
MRIALVWNGRAGSVADVVPEVVQQRLAESGAEVSVLDIRADRTAGECARAALERGAEIVVAAGGDGTVSGVAAPLVGTSARLGVLPLGTSNSFAAALGIPAEVESALALLVAAATPRQARPVVLGASLDRLLDVAVVRGGAGEMTMVLHCMVGLHADVIADTSTEAKQRWGVLAYAASAVKRLAQIDTFAVELQTDHHVVRCRASAVAAANLAPFKTVLAHGPSHLLGDDGRLDLTIVAAETIADAIATGVHLWRTARQGEPADRDSIGSLSTARVTISAHPVQHVLVDGEPFGTTPITLETRPLALRVIATPAPIAEGPPAEASLIGLPALEIIPDARSSFS